MGDSISRQLAIVAVNAYFGLSEESRTVQNITSIQKILKGLPSAEPERAIKDCRNCKHGNYNDHWDTYFCYHSDDCNAWDKWEPSAQPELVRCKDCRHGVDYYNEGDCYCSNPKWGLMYFGGSWEFYCADAERSTDEKTKKN